MVKHRRIHKRQNPMKHTTKKINKSDEKKRKKKEKPMNFDDQPLSRKDREIAQLSAQAMMDCKTSRKRKKNSKNRLLEETMKLGYFQRPWENTEQLVKRISRDNWRVVEGELLKAKYEAAGRNDKEIAREFKELAEIEASKKARRKIHYEKLAKAKASNEEAKFQKRRLKKEAKFTNVDATE